MVQVEKMLGEYDGIDRMRKKRLVKEPEGFLLEPSDSTYNCTICHEQTLSGNMWWYPNALWCPECKRNIDNGVIPKLASEERHEETWLKEFDLEHHYGLKRQTIRKLEKEGMLHPRKLVNSEGRTYCLVYLAKENKEFLETNERCGKK